MATQITGITIAGVAVDFGSVEYAIQIKHGRERVTDSATASSASMVLFVQTETLPSANVADLLNIQAYGVDRFTGRITDVEIRHIKNGVARISLQAIGKVSRLGTKLVESYSTTTQVVSASANEILSLSGETYSIAGGYDVIYSGQTITNQYILDLLQKLADDTGAAIFDTPSGSISFQGYDSRIITDYYEKWQDQGSQTWAAQGSMRWMDKIAVSPSAEVLTLNSNSVIFEPVWRISSDSIVNRVVLKYTAGTYTIENTTSQSNYGLRTLSLDTAIDDASSAAARASSILSRQSDPRWQMGSVEIYMERITDLTQRSKLLALQCGKRVYISDLPEPAPYPGWIGIVEGWGETYTGYSDGQGTHRLTLAISDPLASYAGIAWSVLTSEQWNTINSSVIWADAISTDALV